MLTDCSKIKGINIKFRQHALAEYRHAHHKLNTEYSTVITDIADLFVANANIPNLVPTKLVQSMDLSTDEDEAKVKQMLNNGAMILQWHLHNQDAFMRLTNSNIAFQDAIDSSFNLQSTSMDCTSKRTFVQILSLELAQIHSLQHRLHLSRQLIPT